MSAGKQLEWLATYDRETGALSTYAARECGYGDMERLGYVVNRGAGTIIDLFITAAGREVVAVHSRGVDAAARVKFSD